MVAATAALAGIGAGCGGGSDSTSSSTGTASASASVTKQDYVKSVTQRCGAYQQERQAAEKPLRPIFAKYKGPSEIPSALLKANSDEVVALNQTTETLIDDLQSLPRPQSDADQLAAAFADLDKVKAAFADADQAAQQGDGKALATAYNQVDASLHALGPLSKEYGFSACN